MKKNLRFLLLGTIIMFALLAVEVYKNWDTEQESQEESQRSLDTLYVLKEFRTTLRINKDWNMVKMDADEFYGFTLSCKDTIFCPSLTFIRIDDDLLSLDDDKISQIFLKQLLTEYEEASSKGYYDLRTNQNINVKCFDFEIVREGTRFMCSSCILRQDGTILMTYITRQPHSKELVEILNHIKYDPEV